jgi:hypothetical protein
VKLNKNLFLYLHGMNTGNGDRSIPEGDGMKKNNSSDGNKSNDTASNKSERIKLDWREFRANLFAREQVMHFFHE